MAIEGENKSMKKSPSTKAVDTPKVPMAVVVYVGKKFEQVLSDGTNFIRGEKREIPATLAAKLKTRGEGKEFVAPDSPAGVAAIKARETYVAEQAKKGGE